MTARPYSVQPSTVQSTSPGPTVPNPGLDLLWLLAGLSAGVALVVLMLWVGAANAIQPFPWSLNREAAVMGLPLNATTPAYWYIARASGLLAYLLLWAATFWGILMSSKLARALAPPGLVFALHEFLPMLALVFTVVHGAALLGDTYFEFSVEHLLIPLASPYRPGWTALGVIAVYLTAALVLSFYIRKWIGRRTWRLLHFTSYLAFVLVLLHGMMAGSDSSAVGVQIMYFLTGGSILFLSLVRALTATPTRRSTAST